MSDFPFVAWPPALPVAMWLLAVASLVTCVQRLHTVRTSPGATGPHAVIRNPPGRAVLNAPRLVRGSSDRTAMTDWAYAAGWMAVRAMPEFAARNAFDAGARYAARGGGPEQLRKNLARVIGVPPAEVPDALIRASLASYARYWREAFRLPTMDHRDAGPRTSTPRCRGADNLERGAGRGPRRGVRIAAQR